MFIYLQSRQKKKKRDRFLKGLKRQFKLVCGPAVIDTRPFALSRCYFLTPFRIETVGKLKPWIIRGWGGWFRGMGKVCSTNASLVSRVIPSVDEPQRNR